MLDDSVDAALAVMTIHHWRDPRAGLREMRRVARQRVVVLTWDPRVLAAFWLFDYFPTTAADSTRVPSLAVLQEWLGDAVISTVPIPADCKDGFGVAYWRRPEKYLDPRVRGGMSIFDFLPDTEIATGLRDLRADLASGRWEQRYGVEFPQVDSLDLGYRLIVWDTSPS
jgi:SAM-dependent methyltransferase